MAMNVQVDGTCENGNEQVDDTCENGNEQVDGTCQNGNEQVDGICENGDEPLGSNKMRGISGLAAKLPASQETLCPTVC
jgi:hypothetical protein